MDVVVFAVGILLLVGSACYAMFSKGDLESWTGVGVSGGVGVLGVLYGTLISNPRRQVREAVDHLMRLKITFLAYLRRLHQADQAYTRLLLDDTPVGIEQVRWFSDVVGKIMESTLNPRDGDDARAPSRGADAPDVAAADKDAVLLHGTRSAERPRRDVLLR